MVGYLKGTTTYGIKYYSGRDTNLTAYVDASHGTHLEDGRSRSGIVIMMAGGPILCRAHKQGIVTLSSTEAELVALTEGSTEVLWIRNILEDIVVLIVK